MKPHILLLYFYNANWKDASRKGTPQYHAKEIYLKKILFVMTMVMCQDNSGDMTL